MSDVVIVGDYSVVVFFKALGIDAVAVDKAEAPLKNLAKNLRTKSYKVVLVVEDYYEEVSRELEDQEKIVVPIPSPKGSQNLGLKELKEVVEKAIGIDVFREE